jgi:hypothetical protein
VSRRPRVPESGTMIFVAAVREIIVSVATLARDSSGAR